jgi:hypothetical protein
MTMTRNDRTRPVTTRRDQVLTAYAAGLTVDAIAAELHLAPLTVVEILDNDHRPQWHVVFHPGYGGCGKQPSALEWCSGCGGLVEMPCRLCAARQRALAARG